MSSPSGSESRHFEIFSCSPLTQVQTPPFFSKPMCHAPVVQVPRFFYLTVDKLPFPFSFDGDQVTSLTGADIPVVNPNSSTFRKDVRGVVETGCLALYEKQINK